MSLRKHLKIYYISSHLRMKPGQGDQLTLSLIVEHVEQFSAHDIKIYIHLIKISGLQAHNSLDL